jgi:hypothetical protein
LRASDSSALRGELFPFAHPPHRRFGNFKKFGHIGDSQISLSSRELGGFGGEPDGREPFIVAEDYQGQPLLKRWFPTRDYRFSAITFTIPSSMRL